MRSSFLKVTLSLAAAVTAAAGVFLIMITAFENRMIFFPARFPEGHWEPQAYGVTVEDLFFESSDGVRLHGWFAEASDGAARGDAAQVILWFHGNAGNVTHRLENLKLLTEVGFSVFILDYRGYGKSEGTPDEAGIYLDGRAAYEYLTENRNIPAERIIIFGRSLGAAVAVDLAAEQPCGGVILESAFTNARDMARALVPVVPIGPFLSSRFDSAAKISAIDAPVLIIHGDRDELVPYRLGRALYEAAVEPKRFYPIPGAGHNDTYLVGGPEYFRRLRAFADSLQPPY